MGGGESKEKEESIKFEESMGGGTGENYEKEESIFKGESIGEES